MTENQEKHQICGAAIRENDVSVETAENPALTDDADKRLDEIVLDHALAKSSNVTSPASEKVLESDSTLVNLAGETGSNVATIKKDEEVKRDLTYDIDTKKPVEVVDLEDDFFSMSYKPKFIEIPKKKKKTKSRRKQKGPIDIERTSTTRATASLSPSPKRDVELNSDDIIEVKEIEIPEIKRPKLTRQITPPFMSEEEFKKAYKATKRRDDEFSNCTVYDESEGFAQRLAKLESVATALSRERSATRTNTSESFDLEEEKEVREYTLNITSFIPDSDGHAISLQVKGNKKFSSIISKTLKYLLSQENLIREQYKFLYEPENVVLYADQISIYPLMKVDTLRISAPSSGNPTHVEIGLYTKSQATKIEQDKIRVEQARLTQLEKDEEFERMINSKVESNVEDIYADDFKDIDKETETKSKEHKLLQPSEEPEEDGDYFKIGLKGEDNKKIIVKVNSDTKIIDLVKHYLTKKELPLDTKVRLDFDDEEIHLSGTVGDTELEEDFTIDVYIL